MFISPCTDTTWGDDRLGATETVAPGARRPWSVRPGCYDLLVEFQSGRDVTELDRQLTAGSTYTWTVTD